MLESLEIAGLTATGVAIWAYFDANKSKVFKDESKKTRENFKDIKILIEKQNAELTKTPYQKNTENYSNAKPPVPDAKSSMLPTKKQESFTAESDINLKTEITKSAEHLRSPHEIVSDMNSKSYLANEIYQDFVSIFLDKNKVDADLYQAKKKDAETIRLVAKKKALEAKKSRFEKVCAEILSLGFAEAIDSVGTYSISKTASGEWFKCTQLSLHRGNKRIFNLNKMPHLKKLTDDINACDSKFSVSGGRVFITKGQVYRIKNGIKKNFLL